jgi:hypothetical protein
VPPVRPGDGVQPGAVPADRLPLPAAEKHAMTAMTLTARPVETRLRPLYATGLILSALLSAGVAHFAILRLEYFLTIPFTCCAFFTLRRFQEPLSMIVVKRQ